ncbi:hypothetical protein EBX93_04240 [bacterium]|nr:hypothetical protein [bacterium]
MGISDHLESFSAKSFPANSKALARDLKRYREYKEFLATSGCIKIKTREREKGRLCCQWQTQTGLPH